MLELMNVFENLVYGDFLNLSYGPPWTILKKIPIYGHPWTFPKIIPKVATSFLFK